MIDHNGFKDILRQEISELLNLESQLKASTTNSPKGSLQIVYNKKRAPQFYHYISRKQRKYLSKEKKELASALVQKDYNERLLNVVEDKLQKARELLASYRNSSDDLYKEMDASRRSLLRSHFLTDEEYLKEWYEKYPGNQNSYPINSELYSVRGEHMRSKSEKLLANLFEQYRIPYVYEPQIVLASGNIFYPDFLLLNLPLRKTIIFEHFGLMDDPKYSENMCKKIQVYAMNDIVIGDNFLFSTESKTYQLNEKSVENMLKKAGLLH